jgi:hypothetical protein
MRTYDPSVRASEDNSCLRPHGYRDRLASERAKTVHALDRVATVTGYCNSNHTKNISFYSRQIFCFIEYSLFYKMLRVKSVDVMTQGLNT